MIIIGQIKYTQEDINYAISMYSKKTSTQIAKDIGCSRSWVLKVWIKNNLKNKEKTRSYYLNQEYFKGKITDEKAYILGFIAADGCIYSRDNHQGMLSITLNMFDRKIICFILKEFESETPIKDVSYFTMNNKKTVKSTIQINSDILINDIKSFGIKEKKTFNLDFDFIFNKLGKDNFIPFLYGYFDGDGCITSKDVHIASSYKYTISLPKKNALVLLNIINMNYNLTCNFTEDKRKNKYKEKFGFISFTTNESKFLLSKTFLNYDFGLKRKKIKMLNFNYLIESNISNKKRNVEISSKYNNGGLKIG